MRRQPALGVAHRRRRIAVERAEVARAVDQRIAQREGLRHADQRLVERRVAVRVVAAHHVADHLGALAVLGVGGEVLLPHREQDAALHRLEAVAHVGQRARGDHRERVVQVAALRGVVQRHRAAAVARHAAAGPAASAGGGAAAGPAGVVVGESSKSEGSIGFALGHSDRCQSSSWSPWATKWRKSASAEMRGTLWSMQDWAMSASAIRARRPSASTPRAQFARALPVAELDRKLDEPSHKRHHVVGQPRKGQHLRDDQRGHDRAPGRPAPHARAPYRDRYAHSGDRLRNSNRWRPASPILAKGVQVDAELHLALKLQQPELSMARHQALESFPNRLSDAGSGRRPCLLKEFGRVLRPLFSASNPYGR